MRNGYGLDDLISCYSHRTAYFQKIFRKAVEKQLRMHTCPMPGVGNYCFELSCNAVLWDLDGRLVKITFYEELNLHNAWHKQIKLTKRNMILMRT